MSIRNRLIVIVAVSVVSSTMMLVALKVASDEADFAMAGISMSSALKRSIFDLMTLTQELFVAHGARPKKQWKSCYKDIEKLLQDPRILQGGSKGLNFRMREELQAIGEMFERLIGEIERQTTLDIHDTVEVEILAVLSTRLSTMADCASQIAATAREANATSQKKLRWATTLFIVVVGIVVVASCLFIGLSVINPLARLGKQMEIVGSGNLDHTVMENPKDEIGTLAHNFNDMIANLKEMRNNLLREIDDRQTAEHGLSLLTRALSKRVKELECLFSLSKLIEKSHSLEDVIEGAVEVIPQGWSYSDIACVRIVLGNNVFTSADYSEPVAKQTEDLFLKNKRVGFLEVGYREEKPEADDGPFYKEERRLIRDIAERLEQVVERGEAETALQQHAEALQRADLELEQFGHISSHHLQEPLRKIVNFAELFERRYKGKLDDRADRYIHYLIDGATRMRALIESLITYTRLDRSPPVLAVTDLGALLKVVRLELDTTLRTSGAVVTSDHLPSLEVDAYEMKQVFKNLVGNAMKFQRTGSPMVHVAAEELDDEWLFSVRDNGIGIEADFSERIFGIFQRLHSPGEFSGTGMGLALCKKIVERHGGRMWVESEPGKGSTFFFTLSRG